MFILLAVDHPRCLDGWIGYGNQCYLFKQERTTWDDARSKCRLLSGDLATINSRSQQEFLNTQFAICRYCFLTVNRI